MDDLEEGVEEVQSEVEGKMNAEKGCRELCAREIAA